MELPFGMRPSTLAERKAFYTKFDFARARDWIGRKAVYAVIMGRHSNIYPPEYKADKDVPLAIDNYRSLADVRAKVLKFLPEGVYYDRNYYKDFSLCHSYALQKAAWRWSNFDGQQLAFDIDPENVLGKEALEKRIRSGQGLSFSAEMFWRARDNTLLVHDLLAENYSDLRIVFSGRGFHVHVFDDDARWLSRKERAALAGRFSGLGIDKWVTEGESRLIRLPYSLNGASTRVVTPLKKSRLEKIDPAKDFKPSFPSCRSSTSS